MSLYTRNGGYTVHPVPAPASAKADPVSNNAGGKSQNEILFKREPYLVLQSLMEQTIPNPPIIVGITKKKIITKA